MALESTNEPRLVGDEVRAGRPWWKICCGGCFLFLFVLIVGAAFLWRGAGGGRGPQILTELPANFPPSISLYRLEEAQSIEYFSGGEKNRAFSALLSPLKMFGSVMVSTSNNTDGSASTTAIQRLMDTSVSRIEQIDTVTVRWNSLDVSRDEALRFYLESFQRNGFTVDARREDATATDNVIARRDDITVQLMLQDVGDVPGIESLVIVVDYLNQNQ
jgi:hypothetical protein